jgi:dCMP deaminase
MDFAVNIARRSTCSRLQVGAVVVSEDNTRILGHGYNGGPAGGFNDCISLEPGKCGHLHAEINALVKTNYHDAAQKKIYVTTVPCFNCSVAIVNANIKEVVYLHDYRDHSGLELLEKSGIKVRKFVQEVE